MKRILLMSSLALLCLAGCSGGEHEPAAASAESTAVVTEDAQSAPATTTETAADSAGNSAAPTPPKTDTVTAAPRQVIYTGDVAVKVADYDRAGRQVDSLLTRHHAYLTEGDENRTVNERVNTMTIKVPPGEFLPLITALGRLGRLEDKHISSSDVTTQVVDVAARIRAKKAVEAHLLTLLTKAKNTNEMLQVEEQLKAAREEIEAAQTHQLALVRQAAMATITLRYFQPLPLEIPETPIVSFWPRLVQAFYFGWSLLLNLIVGLTHVWPFWTFGPLLFWLWTRLLRPRLIR